MTRGRSPRCVLWVGHASRFLCKSAQNFVRKGLTTDRVIEHLNAHRISPAAVVAHHGLVYVAADDIRALGAEPPMQPGRREFRPKRRTCQRVELPKVDRPAPDTDQPGRRTETCSPMPRAGRGSGRGRLERRGQRVDKSHGSYTNLPPLRHTSHANKCFACRVTLPGPERAQFVVCLHDVFPQHGGAILRLLDQLQPWVGTRISVAVTPCAFGRPWTDEDGALARRVQALSHELLLHGFTHQSTTSRWLSRHIEHADEFHGRERREAEGRIRSGLQMLRQQFTRTVRGFVPPGWHMGPITARSLRECGLDFAVRWTAVETVSGWRQPLATLSWDCGPVRATGYAGELFGKMTAMLLRGVPCIVVHPRDLERGFLPRIIRCLRKLLDAGRRPTQFAELILASSGNLLREGPR